MTFKLESPSFANGAVIPKQFTCEGQNISPELRWSEVPANTKSFTLIMDDPDAPGGTWTHWVLFNIPASAQKLAERSIALGVEATTSFGKPGYGGPCPPRGNGPHRYFLKLYALDVDALNLKAGVSRREVETAMKTHIVGQAQWMGTYERK
jgi:Raf kinase inhibitor-like YbhB/YbcL family protein